MALNTIVFAIIGSVLGVIVCTALGWVIYSQWCGKKKKKSYRSLPTLEGGQAPEPETCDEAAPLVQVSADPRTGQICYELANMKTKSAQPAADAVQPPQARMAAPIFLQTVRPLPPPSSIVYSVQQTLRPLPPPSPVVHSVQYPATSFPAGPSRSHVEAVPFASFNGQVGVQPMPHAGNNSSSNLGGASNLLMSSSSNYPASSAIAEGVARYPLPHRQARSQQYPLLEVGPELQGAINRTHETGKYRPLAGAEGRQFQESPHSSVNNLLSSQATVDFTWPEKLDKVEHMRSHTRLDDSEQRTSERRTASGADRAKRIQESRTSAALPHNRQDRTPVKGRKKSTEAARPRAGSPTRTSSPPPRKGSPPRTRSPPRGKPE
eukprot:TRINITY_DN51591_c0_g1_i1.p1 TRINITY_DN51591_c0_g1~~TRINITY_DN51591_c0_g1_i1.p1  ORF type:complete len:378 (-),score=36.85 TRINITY_DN51591_c0_g1_i1:64-1197(-)